MKKNILLAIAALFVLAIIISLIPKNSSKENTVKVSGIVKSVAEGGVHDLIFELENDKTTYYINRGLENGFNLKQAEAKYIGKKATINYTKNWTLVAPFGTVSESILQISIDGKEIYYACK